MYAIRLRNNWHGEVDGKKVNGRTNDVIEVDRSTMDALCGQRTVADPLTTDEYKEYLSQQTKPQQKKKAQKAPPKNKMITMANTKAEGSDE